MDIEALICESMVYERAYALIESIISGINNLKKTDLEECKLTHEESDKSFDIVLKAIQTHKKEFREQSDSYWKRAERISEYPRKNIEALANTVVYKAVADYEIALCGHGNESEKKMIELFAENGAESFTKINLNSVLDKIRQAQPIFAKIARENANEIARESKKKSEVDMKTNKYKCPLCGGGMFLYGKIHGGAGIIRCTGCYLQEAVEIK